MKRFVFFTTLLVLSNGWLGAIIPEPVNYKQKGGKFTITPSTPIHILGEDSTLLKQAEYLQSFLNKPFMAKLRIIVHREGAIPTDGIILRIDSTSLPPEGYTLEIGRKTLFLTGKDAAGVFYGIQTIRQMLPPETEKTTTPFKSLKIRCAIIEDYPRFSYRGMHLDVARHFFDVDFIKRYLDLMSLYKFNHFHWHLTDDQGWRIEIKQYPQLTEVGAWRHETLVGHGSRPPFEYDGVRHGGFYTQDQIREIVEYATERHITVVPEIEMPGHATAALAAYPHLGCTGGPYKVETRWGIFEDAFCAGNDSTFAFLENVLDEVLGLFPSPIIHIGGDECLKNRWKECPLCQQRIADEELADEHELQSYFIARIQKYVESKGRQIVGWDEILEGGLTPGSIIMSWRGVRGGIEAVKEGHQVIMTPTSHSYLDFYQAEPETQPLAIGGYLTLRQVYTFNPVPDGLTQNEARLILGGQGNLWTEYIPDSQRVEYMVFPRAIALAETLWTPKNQLDFDRFQGNLNDQLKRLDVLNVNYFRP